MPRPKSYPDDVNRTSVPLSPSTKRIRDAVIEQGTQGYTASSILYAALTRGMVCLIPELPNYTPTDDELHLLRTLYRNLAIYFADTPHTALVLPREQAIQPVQDSNDDMSHLASLLDAGLDEEMDQFSSWDDDD